MTEPTPRTRAILDLLFQERQIQEDRYREINARLESGTGPDVQWLAPYTDDDAEAIQLTLRQDYEELEMEVGEVTWAYLVREEIAEAFQEDDPTRLAEELIQVAALCVSWVERLPIPLPRETMCEECGEVVAVEGASRLRA